MHQVIQQINRIKTALNFIHAHPLSKRHLVRSYFNYFSWQLSQMVYPRQVVLPFVGNTKLVLRKGLTGATGNIYTGLHEFADMTFLLHFLRKEDLFFDIGANVGSYTILASGYCGAKTVAFEPIPSTFDWLAKNIAINNIQYITHARNIGVSSRKAFLNFTNCFDTVNHVVSISENDGVENVTKVPVWDFDSIVANEGLPQLVKIDVEGFETEVINGMTTSLKSTSLKAIIIELNGSGRRYGFEEHLIHKKLIANEFLPYQYEPFARTLTSITQFGPHNTIYIKDIDFVKDRLQSAKKVPLFSEMI